MNLMKHAMHKRSNYLNGWMQVAAHSQQNLFYLVEKKPSGILDCVNILLIHLKILIKSG